MDSPKKRPCSHKKSVNSILAEYGLRLKKKELSRNVGIILDDSTSYAVWTVNQAVLTGELPLAPISPEYGLIIEKAGSHNILIVDSQTKAALFTLCLEISLPHASQFQAGTMKTYVNGESRYAYDERKRLNDILGVYGIRVKKKGLGPDQVHLVDVDTKDTVWKITPTSIIQKELLGQHGLIVEKAGPCHFLFMKKISKEPLFVLWSRFSTPGGTVFNIAFFD